jgi:hypothetical protein
MVVSRFGFVWFGWVAGSRGQFAVATEDTAVSRSAKSIDLFITSGLGGVFTSRWTKESGWSGIHDNWDG